MYASGQGVPQDFAEAARWYEKAADQNDPLAQGALGELYANGQGTPRDPVRAAGWYRKAAGQGYGPAQFSLGSSDDGAKAHSLAVKNRDKAAANMTAAQIAEAERLAREWTPTITGP
jgi:hypothetical protein